MATDATSANECYHSSSVQLSEQWLLAESAAEMLLEVEELDAEMSYGVCELSVSGGTRALAILIRTPDGVVAFLEDRFGAVWLMRRASDCKLPSVQCLKTDKDQADTIAEQCLDTLIKRPMIVSRAVRMH